MAKNIVEKILAKTCGRDEVSVGEYLPKVGSNRPVAGSYLLHSSGHQIRETYGKLFDPTLYKIIGGGHVGAGGVMGVITGDMLRRNKVEAKELGIPDENILSMGQGGIEHVVSGEKCWPWVKNWYGENSICDDAQFGGIARFIWIDQDLKAEMGFK